MEKMNKIMSLLLIFAGISAFDIQAAAKQPKSEEETKTANGLLFNAIEAKDWSQIEDALKKGADINARGVGGNTPLLFAFGYARNHSYIGDLLILYKGDNGVRANVNAQNKNGDTSLTLIASLYDGSVQSVKLLLEHGADISIKNNKGQTALDIDPSLKKVYEEYIKEKNK